MVIPYLRFLMLGLFIVCAGMLAFAVFYLEGVLGLEACPLCMSQRVFFAACGVFGLLAFLHNPGLLGLRIYALLIALSGALGAALAGRHLWLQSLPPELAPACGPSLAYMLEAFPLSEALQLMLMGDGNCSETVWRFLGISIPGWSMIAFIAIILFALASLFQRSR